MTASPSLVPHCVPLLSEDLFEGACYLSERLGVNRLLIVRADGRPVATFVRTGKGVRLEKPSLPFYGAAANVPLLWFARMHLLKIGSQLPPEASR